MIAWDIDNGAGVTVVDPHGQLTNEILESHIPRSRKNDVIVFDPTDRTHVMGLNILDCQHHENPGLVVSQLVSIFNKLWASRGSC